MLEAIPGFIAGIDPLTWWLVAFVGFGLIAGITTGYFKARKIQPGGFRWRTFRNEIGIAIINLTITTLVLGAVTKWMQAEGIITFNAEPAAWWVIALEFALYIIVFDTWFYWAHRLMHIEPIYSWTHKVHHRSISPNSLTAYSMHPIESIVEGAIIPLFTAVFTVHDATMLWIAPCAPLMGLYVHSGFELFPRWWNKSWATKWFITATFHDQHHRYFKGNYGGFSTVWDRICGTVRPNFEADFEKVTTRRIRPLAVPEKSPAEV